MRKVLSLVLALSMVLGMFSFAFASGLSDIEGQDYQASVEALMELGVVTGNPDGTYKGNNVVTRAELAKMLVVSLGQEQAAKIAKGSTQFTDVAAEHWASGYINVAAQSKVIVGYPDGTFLPEETVSYAEAVTMALRALGYKNVVESAGTWPTNYITKANELQLLKDMKGIDAEAGAKRGNVAILLWNMLRTEMWDVDSENQTNGMTYRKTEEPMLNIKFPDYEYEDEAYFKDVTIADGKITIEVCPDEKLAKTPVSGEIKNVDLLRLVKGMKVAYLYNKDDEEFLTLTTLDTIVEGTVTKVTGTTKFEIDDVEYKNENAVALAVNNYVVCLVDGKKAEEVVVLPTNSTKVEKIRTMENKIDEDAVVIIDGELATRDDIKVDDIYTKVSGLAHLTGEFYAVARERVDGTFESFTVTTNKEVTDRYSIEVDGTEYTALETNFKAYEDEDNDKLIDTDDLREKAKDNKYLDKDVELVFNYVGQVIEMNFGEVSDLDAEGDFYVMTSDGAWYTASSKGKTYHVVLAGINGEEDEYDFVNATAATAFDGMNYYKTKNTFDAKFYFANFNNDEAIKTLTELANGGKYADDKYRAYAFTTEMTDDNYIGTYKVTASTIVVTATPVVDDDDNVVEVKVNVTQGPKALEGVEEGMLVYETEKNARAKFVFVSEEAESQELNFGLVEEYKESKGIQYVYISGERYEIDDDSDLKKKDVKVNQLVAFTNTNGKINMKAIYKAEDIDGAALVKDVDDEFVTFNVAVPVDTANNTAKLVDTTLDDVKEVYKKYTFVVADASLDDENKVEFDADVEVLGEGIEKVSFKKGDRISMSKNPNVKVVIIVRGLDKDDTFVDGVAQ